MSFEMDPRDLEQIGPALDGLEELHDHMSALPIRRCLCAEASAWRGAMKVYVHWRQQLGLRVRLLDQTIDQVEQHAQPG